MNNTGWIAVIIVVLIVLLGGWWWFSNQATVAPATDTTATETPATADDGATAGASADASADVGIGDNSTATVVHYTASGFLPKSVTIQKGAKVTFINDTSGPMWVAADEHPTHTSYDNTSRETHCSGSYAGATPFDECQNGTTFTFVFAKAGTFQYHNHSAANFEGTVVVQ